MRRPCAEGGTNGSQTLRWRKADSNRWSHLRSIRRMPVSATRKSGRARARPAHRLSKHFFSAVIRCGAWCFSSTSRPHTARRRQGCPRAHQPDAQGLTRLPMRFSVRVSPATTKPARVTMFIPKRMSLVSITFLPRSGSGPANLASAASQPGLAQPRWAG
jgi:hypothetical protein